VGWLDDDPRLRIALTGGIASGKSLAAGSFRSAGAAVLDADAAARAVTAPGSTGLAALVARFGADVLAADGTLDRRRLRELAFADPALRLALEAELHPLILAELARQARAAAGPYLVFVVPLLVEQRLAGRFHRVVVVDCGESDQLARLVSRDGESDGSARRILAAQASRAERLAVADHVLENRGDEATLAAAVAGLHRGFLELSAAPPFPPPRRRGENGRP
jgi:dephospho-CoA kinase